MKKILLLSTLLISSISFGQKKELEQLPIIVYDYIKKFEVNPNLEFVSEIPEKVYLDEDKYYLIYKDDRITEIDKDLNYIYVVTTPTSENKKTYKLRLINNTIFGTMEYKTNNSQWFYVYKNKRIDYKTFVSLK